MPNESVAVLYLIDADRPRSRKTLPEKYGHEAIDAREAGLRNANDPVIARYGLDHQACMITVEKEMGGKNKRKPLVYPLLHTHSLGAQDFAQVRPEATLTPGNIQLRAATSDSG